MLPQTTPSFQTFAVLWILCSFFWVILRCLNFVTTFRNTLPIFIGLCPHTTYGDGTVSLFRNVDI